MFLPKSLRRHLEANRFYMHIRYSPWIYRLWLLMRRDVRKEIEAKASFYESVLPAGCRLVFDIGANEGIMTDIFRRMSAKVVAVEPSYRNLQVLSARFHSDKRIIIAPLAISNTSGPQAWFEDKNDFAMGTLSPKWKSIKEENSKAKTTLIQTTTLDALVEQFGTPDYVKIDIEGHEWQALQGLTKPVALLSFEAILPHFLEETIACIHHLSKLNINASFNYLNGNRFAYSNYQHSNLVINDIKEIRQTVDIFCKMEIFSF